MSTVSTATIRQATAVCNALEGNGITVSGVVFDPESDTFAVELAGGGMIDTSGLGGGTVKTEGLGGGTVKEDE